MFIACFLLSTICSRLGPTLSTLAEADGKIFAMHYFVKKIIALNIGLSTWKDQRRVF